MKIKFEMHDSGICLDSCKHYPSIKIGSSGCLSCLENLELDYNSKTVECKKYEKKIYLKKGVLG